MRILKTHLVSFSLLLLFFSWMADKMRLYFPFSPLGRSYPH